MLKLKKSDAARQLMSMLDGQPLPPPRSGRMYRKRILGILRDDFDDALGDRELSELRGELALLTARIAELLGELGSGPPPWEEVQILWRRVAEVGGDTGPLVAELDALIAGGAAAARDQRAVWREVRELVQEKTKTASAEWRRMHDLQGLVQLDKVMDMWRGMLGAVKLNVTNPTTLRAIVVDMMRLMPPSMFASGHGAEPT